jgi:hypothetical protein
MIAFSWASMSSSSSSLIGERVPEELRLVLMDSKESRGVAGLTDGPGTARRMLSSEDLVELERGVDLVL